MGFGYIIDKIKVWKIVLLFHIFMMMAIVVFVSYTPTEDGVFNATVHNPTGMTAGFIGMQMMATIQIGCTATLSAKAVE